MRKSPVTVQQWVDAIEPPQTPNGCSKPASIYTASLRSPRKGVPREISLQSDDASSLCSSVESVLELRKPDPEAVLLGLGFGPPKGSNLVSRIPARFLQPSKLLTHIDLEKFLEQYGEKYSEQQHSAPSSPARGLLRHGSIPSGHSTSFTKLQ